MRKNFKVFFLVLSLIFVASFFTSCSHSDADSPFPEEEYSYANDTVLENSFISEDLAEEFDEVIYEKYPDDSYGKRFVIVRSGDYYGIVNGFTGEVLLHPDKYKLTKIRLNTYEEVYPLIEVERDNIWGMIDYHGNMVIEPAWDALMMDVYNVPNVVFVFDGDKWGGIRLTFENYINQFEYDSVSISEVDYTIELSDELKHRIPAQ